MRVWHRRDRLRRALLGGAVATATTAWPSTRSTAGAAVAETASVASTTAATSLTSERSAAMYEPRDVPEHMRRHDGSRAGPDRVSL